MFNLNGKKSNVYKYPWFITKQFRNLCIISFIILIIGIPFVIQDHKITDAYAVDFLNINAEILVTVLAVTMTFTLLGLQFLAKSYTPRALVAYLKDWVIFGFQLFYVSLITLSMISVTFPRMLLPEILQPVEFIQYAFLGTIYSLIYLICFIYYTIKKIQPEEIISDTWKNIQSENSDLIVNNKGKLDSTDLEFRPFIILEQTLLKSIKNNDIVSFNLGMEKMEELLMKWLKDIHKEDKDKIEKNENRIDGVTKEIEKFKDEIKKKNKLNEINEIKKEIEKFKDEIKKKNKLNEIKKEIEKNENRINRIENEIEYEYKYGYKYGYKYEYKYEYEIEKEIERIEDEIKKKNKEIEDEIEKEEKIKNEIEKEIKTFKDEIEKEIERIEDEIENGIKRIDIENSDKECVKKLKLKLKILEKRKLRLKISELESKPKYVYDFFFKIFSELFAECKIHHREKFINNYQNQLFDQMIKMYDEEYKNIEAVENYWDQLKYVGKEIIELKMTFATDSFIENMHKFMKKEFKKIKDPVLDQQQDRLKQKENIWELSIKSTKEESEQNDITYALSKQLDSLKEFGETAVSKNLKQLVRNIFNNLDELLSASTEIINSNTRTSLLYDVTESISEINKERVEKGMIYSEKNIMEQISFSWDSDIKNIKNTHGKDNKIVIENLTKDFCNIIVDNIKNGEYWEVVSLRSWSREFSLTNPNPNLILIILDTLEEVWTVLLNKDYSKERDDSINTIKGTISSIKKWNPNNQKIIDKISSVLASIKKGKKKRKKKGT